MLSQPFCKNNSSAGILQLAIHCIKSPLSNQAPHPIPVLRPSDFGEGKGQGEGLSNGQWESANSDLRGMDAINTYAASVQRSNGLPSRRSMVRTIGLSSRVTSEIAMPSRSMRPVRPMRWV